MVFARYVDTHHRLNAISGMIHAAVVRREQWKRNRQELEALAAEMEAIEAECEAYDEDADESGKMYPAIEEKADGVGESWIRLPNRLNIFLPVILQFWMLSALPAMKGN